MPVFRWRENWEPLRDLESQVERLLEGIPFPFPAIRFERHYPPVNLYELGSEYLLTAELPGTDPARLTIRCIQPASRAAARSLRDGTAPERGWE